MILLEQAIEMILSEVKPITRTRLVTLERAVGCIVTEDIRATIDIPPFDRSPLDGFAVRSEDISEASGDAPVKLSVVSEIFAGNVWDGNLAKGQAARIMTGGMLPKGADCVVMQEDANDMETEVEIKVPAKPMQNICFRGEDVKRETIIASKDTTISYAHLGVLASSGYNRVLVRDKVRAGLLSTGDELTLPGEPLSPGKIYNSNIFMLAGRMEQLRINVTSLYKVGDDVSEVCCAIEREIEGVDIFFTTGGVSVGRRDIMHPVIERLGARKLFWKVALKPGTPALAAVYCGKLLLCLSGNPFASSANFELLGRPALYKLSGDKSLKHVRVKGVMADDFSKSSSQRRFVRAVFEDGCVFLPPYNHSSGALMSLIGCNALIDIPAGNSGLKKGECVELIML